MARLLLLGAAASPKGTCPLAARSRGHAARLALSLSAITEASQLSARARSA